MPGISPCRDVEYWEEMLYALAAWRPCVGLLASGGGPPISMPCSGDREIPTKTPHLLCQSFGRYSLLFRHPFHVLLTSFLFRALLANLILLVRCRSIVSLLLIAFTHLLVVSATMLWCSWPSSSLICLSLRSFHIKKAVSETMIL